MLKDPTPSKPYKMADGRWGVAINCGTDPATGRRRRPIVTAKTRKEAVDKAKAKAEAIRSGVKLDGGKTTVSDWLDYWFEQVVPLRGLRPTTVRSYRTRADQTIRPALGSIQLAGLTAAHIRQMHAEIARAGQSIATARLTHTVLAKALDDAVAEQMIATNAAKVVDKPQGARTLRPALTADQAAHLIRTCEAAGDPMTYRWAAAILTGARQGEILGLTWDRVDFERKRIDLSWSLVNVGYVHGCPGAPSSPSCGATAATCPAKQLNTPRGYTHIPLSGPLVLGLTKTTSSTRVIPLIAPLERALRDHLAAYPVGEHGLVWTNPRTGTPIHPRNDLAAWHRALARAGLPKIPLHSARHTAATLMQSIHVPEAVRMSILGHNSQAEHRGYAHVDDGLARAALESYGTALGLTVA
ncbi:Putative phage integrase [Mycobacteroides abscessus subsp. abscessus]|nr:Putative phage integrase [Mycobacteroides abscessus subsp. abscessus]